MARLKAKIELSHVSENGELTEILRAAGVYAIFYDGMPIGIRRGMPMFSNHYRYPKILFANKGYALVKAARFNKRFKTDKFAVYLLSDGEKITKP